METLIDVADLVGGKGLSVNAMFSRCLRGLSSAQGLGEPHVEPAVDGFHPAAALERAGRIAAGGASRMATYIRSPEMSALRPRLHERRGWARRWSA